MRIATSSMPTVLPPTMSVGGGVVAAAGQGPGEAPLFAMLIAAEATANPTGTAAPPAGSILPAPPADTLDPAMPLVPLAETPGRFVAAAPQDGTAPPPASILPVAAPPRAIALATPRTVRAAILSSTAPAPSAAAPAALADVVAPSIAASEPEAQVPPEPADAGEAADAPTSPMPSTDTRPGAETTSPESRPSAPPMRKATAPMPTAPARRAATVTGKAGLTPEPANDDASTAHLDTASALSIPVAPLPDATPAAEPPAPPIAPPPSSTPASVTPVPTASPDIGPSPVIAAPRPRVPAGAARALAPLPADPATAPASTPYAAPASGRKAVAPMPSPLPMPVLREPTEEARAPVAGDASSRPAAAVVATPRPPLTADARASGMAIAAPPTVPFPADASMTTVLLATAPSPAAPPATAAPAYVDVAARFAPRQAPANEPAPLAIVTDERDDAVVALAPTAPIHRIAPADTAPAPLDLRRDTWPATMIDRIETLRDAANAADTRIRVVPDALGTIDVSLRREGDTVHVHFTAEQAQTRALLAEAQPRLAELAEARGLRLGGGSVDGGQHQHQPPHRQPAPQPVSTAAARRVSADADAAAGDGRIA